jgi:DNA polymerase III epsilon subunit-like protein
MTVNESNQLSKKEKGKLKKLKGRASSPGTNSPGITNIEDALELRSLLKKSNSDDTFGPSVHHVQYDPSKSQDPHNWKQTEGSDHRHLIQSLLLGFWQSGNNGQDNNNNKNKKRKSTRDNDVCIPSWCRLHNGALVENISVIEFSISASGDDATLLMPSHRLRFNKTNESATDKSSIYQDDEEQCILAKLVSEKGFKGKRALPMSCKLFQGDRPRHITDLLMYLEPKPKSNKKSKTKLKAEEGPDVDNEDQYIDIFEMLESLTMTTQRMRKEGYPMKCNPESDHKYVSTYLKRDQKAQDPNPASTPIIFAIDCEMVRTSEGPEGIELARVTLLQFCPTIAEPEKYVVVLDELVKPTNQITDYLTKWSGITASMMEGATTRLEHVQAKLLSIICEDDILIGQSTENDLKACRLIHMKVIDTAILFQSEGGRKHSLKHLSAVLLKKKIQNDQSNGHCSEEDAAAALLLAVRRARLGDGFQIHGKIGKKNIFGVISNMRRKPNEVQPSYLRYNRGPIVCLGPNDWIQEHVGSQCLVNALQCDNISSSATKAIASYLRPSGRRASILWSRLSIDSSDPDGKTANDKIDHVIVSEWS